MKLLVRPMSRVVSPVFMLLFFLNLADAFSTHYWVTNGLAEEINPIAIFLLGVHPTLFLIIKCLFGTICLWLLWLARERYKKIITTIVFCWLGVYSIILIFHLRVLVQYLNNS